MDPVVSLNLIRKLEHSCMYRESNSSFSVRFEVFTAMTMKNGAFWDVTPRGSFENRRFGGT
jgi:hypothetical protein